MATMNGASACTAAGSVGAFNFNGAGTNVATLSATLQGSGCGSITVKNCYSDAAAISVTVGSSQAFSTVSPHNTDRTFYFTFANNDVLGISDGASGVAQIESLVFHPNNHECLAAAVNAGGWTPNELNTPPQTMTAVR
jgi:hypothetical protein